MNKLFFRLAPAAALCVPELALGPADPEAPVPATGHAGRRMQGGQP